MTRTNEFGQPIGDLLPEGWSPPPRPKKEPIIGQHVQLEPLDPSHTKDLFEANQLDKTGEGWTYLPYGPFGNKADLQEWIDQASASEDPLFFTYVDQTTGKAVGWGSYLRIEPSAGSIEVGHIRMSPLMQRTIMSGEAMHLMMKNAFDLGYRRYEWKCDALNAPSCQAAKRLGFTFEGIFRQATHYKGRNRDTAWFAITDSDWPQICAAQQAWLDPSNFDDAGKQKSSFFDLIEQKRVKQ